MSSFGTRIGLTTLLDIVLPPKKLKKLAFELLWFNVQNQKETTLSTTYLVKLKLDDIYSALSFSFPMVGVIR